MSIGAGGEVDPSALVAGERPTCSCSSRLPPAVAGPTAAAPRAQIGGMLLTHATASMVIVISCLSAPVKYTAKGMLARQQPVTPRFPYRNLVPVVPR